MGSWYRGARPLLAGGRTEERIVTGRRAISVHPQDLSMRVGKRLRVVADGVVAHGNIQLAVGSEMNRSAVVIGCAERIEVDDDGLRGRAGRSLVGALLACSGEEVIGRARVVDGEPADPVVDAAL